MIPGEETVEQLDLLGPVLEPGLEGAEEDNLAILGDLNGVETTVLSASRASATVKGDLLEPAELVLETARLPRAVPPC